MDIEKAVDSLNHSFLTTVLKKYWIWGKFHRLDQNDPTFFLKDLASVKKLLDIFSGLKPNFSTRVKLLELGP